MGEERHLSLPEVTTNTYSMTPHRFTTPCTPSVFTFDTIPETDSCATPYSYRSYDYMNRNSEGQFFNRFNDPFLNSEPVDSCYLSNFRKHSLYLDRSCTQDGDFFQDYSPMLVQPRRSSLQSDDLFSSSFSIFPRAYSTSPAFPRSLYHPEVSMPSMSSMQSTTSVPSTISASTVLTASTTSTTSTTSTASTASTTSTTSAAAVALHTPKAINQAQAKSATTTPTKQRRLHSRATSPNKVPSLTDPANVVNLENVLSGKDKRTTLMIKNIPNA